MKKTLISVLIITFTFITSSYGINNLKITPDVRNAIMKYKAQNYAGCVQGMQKAIDGNQLSDLSIAYYYLANSYAKLGLQDKAIENYDKVITLNTSPGLVNYAKQGSECLKNLEQCKNTENINGFIRSNEKVNKKVYYDLQSKEIQTVQTDINNNSGKDQNINFNKYKYLNDASDEMPSDKEIADAVKTLAKVGFNPYGQNFNPQQLNMLFGQSNYSNQYNNMLPYLMAQNNNKDTDSESQKKQILQLMMLNQMPSGF